MAEKTIDKRSGTRERNSERITFVATPTFQRDLDAFVEEHSEYEGNASAVIKKAVENLIERGDPTPATPLLALPILSSIPAGKVEEAFTESPTKIQINGDWQRELSAYEGDALFYVHGQSMKGAHIPDGALILVEPVPRHKPVREGRPCVVQIVDADGEYHVTLKKWSMKNGKPQLLDGDDKVVKFDFTVREMWPFGVVKRAILDF